MDREQKPLFQFFDPLADFGIQAGRNLPHWMQSRTVCFITWRTWDSMPADVVERWQKERVAWLAKHGIRFRNDHWQMMLQELAIEQRREYYRSISARWEAYLDNCLGTCPLRRPELAKVVADSLHHFDGIRYCLTDFVIMPNHVHLLAAFQDAETLLKQCDSWKHFTAVQLNKQLGRKGRFWEPESFDHLVRSEEQWVYLRQYIRDNPIHAKLCVGEYLHYSAEIK